MDLDNDGHKDLISGSWPGEIFFFKGTEDGSFAAPEMIKNKDGEIINIGGGVREGSSSMGYTLIAGNAKFERTSEGTFVNYHGKRFKSTPDKPYAITGTASTARAADWDGDGDYDLIIGDIRGKVYLVPNEGTAESYAFGKEEQLRAGGRPIGVGGKAGPFAADWDSDGDLDLLVGAEDGSVKLYRNTGSAQSPELASAVQLVPPGDKRYGAAAPKEVLRGNRSKICVADWNGDGLLDLLVGDSATQKPDRPEPTAEQKAEYDRIREELKPVQERYGELSQKLRGPSRVTDEDQITKIQEEMGEIRKRMTGLHSKLPREYESHGWVWLFLRSKAN
ncbi:MAG: FG-GAP repeat domain-containing protein [Planctomycetota bacterium]